MKKTLVLAVFLAALGSGCVMTDVTTVMPGERIDIPKTPYVRLGKVQAESWGICLAYVAPLWGSPDSAKAAALERARAQGAEAVINAEAYTETHMPLLMLLGWKEHHFSGDAIRYVK